MDKLRKYIRHLIKEAEYDIPDEILDTLKDKLQMNPIERFVSHFKAVNSIPPSYRIFLLNNKHFDIYYEEFSLMIKIGPKEYYIADLDERNYAIKHINRLLTQPTMKQGDVEDEEDLDLGSPPPKLGRPPSIPKGTPGGAGTANKGGAPPPPPPPTPPTPITPAGDEE